MAILPEKQKLEVVSYVGSSLGEFSADGDRPPRSAKLVAKISWSWGPAHSACLRYLICTDRQRKGWTLWAVADDWDGRMYAQLAYATPFRGQTAKFAAEQLLTATWRAERLEMCDEDLRGACVNEEGLLTKPDVERIECEVFGPRT